MKGGSRCLGPFLLAAFLLSALNSPQFYAGPLQSPESSQTRGLTDTLERGWTDRTQSIHPPGVAGSMMAYDARNNLFVLFGGSDGEALNQTWVLDPTTQSWSEVHPRISPPSRADAMLVYDSTAGALVLFGGWYETPDGGYHRLSDTWAFYVGNVTWTQRNPQT